LYERDPRGTFFSSVVYANHGTFHTTLKSTPGKLVFGRDMVLPINFVADVEGAIEQKRQKKMARNNKGENASRINNYYKVGDKVHLKKPGKHRKKIRSS
jgi:hypothetical protein